MKKKQESQIREPMVHIPHDQMVAHFERLSHYDGEQFELVKSFYREKYLHDQPSHKLMQLEARPILGNIDETPETDEIRRSYRFGVVVGSVIARQELERVDEYTSALEVYGTGSIDWPALQLSRFALRNFFADGATTRKIVASNLEMPLRAQGADFVSAENSSTANDWLVVGLGDALAFNRASYRDNKGQQLGLLSLENLNHEPSLGL